MNYISSKRQKQNRRKESAKIGINAKLIRQKKIEHRNFDIDLLSLNMLKGFTYPFTDNFNRHLYVL